MNMGKTMLFGMWSMGVKIECVDKERNLVYISVPKESVYYDQASTIKTPQDLARSIKEKVFYKEGKTKILELESIIKFILTKSY